MTRSKINENILKSVMFIKELKKLKRLKSFKMISDSFIVIAFVNDTPLRVVVDDATETMDIHDIENIFDVQQFNEIAALEVIKEMECIDSTFNFRAITVRDFRDFLEFIQKDKLKYYKRQN